jgi:hypothetical protein
VQGFDQDGKRHFLDHREEGDLQFPIPQMSRYADDGLSAFTHGFEVLAALYALEHSPVVVFFGLVQGSDIKGRADEMPRASNGRPAAPERILLRKGQGEVPQHRPPA